MNQVRIQGDPFGDDAPASLLRSFLRQALGSGMRCALSVVAPPPAPAIDGQQRFVLADGREVGFVTRLPPAEIELLRNAANEAVAASAPVVVFAPPAARESAVLDAGLAWPQAAVVLAARDGVTPLELLQRVRAELRWAGSEDPPHGLTEAELAPWLALPDAVPGGPIVGCGDVGFGGGLELLVAAWRQELAPAGRRLRLIVSGAQPATFGPLRQAIGAHGAAVEFVTGPFEPAVVRDAAAIVLPWRRCLSTRPLVQALASGRPVLASRFAVVAPLLDRPGTCLPLPGRNVAEDAGHGPHFAPAPAALAAALHGLRTPSTDAARLGRSARTFVVETLVRGRPARPPRPLARSGRPIVVLEVPLDDSASSAFVLATAGELVRAGRVDLRLVAPAPLPRAFAALRTRAPGLAALFARNPGDAEVWLSAGSPLRSARPPCRVWAMHVAETDDPLPVAMMPHVTQDADAVFVPDERTARVLTAAGRSAAGTVTLPFGGAAAAAVIEDLAAGRWRAAAAAAEPDVLLPRGEARRRTGVPQSARG